MFLIAALALSGLPLSGVFRSEFQIITAGFAKPTYVAASLLVILVNLAFFGVVWHIGGMTLSTTPTLDDHLHRETSRWMVVAMLGCLIVLVGLGLHVPGDLQALLSTASRSLVASGPR